MKKLNYVYFVVLLVFVGLLSSNIFASDSLVNNTVGRIAPVSKIDLFEISRGEAQNYLRDISTGDSSDIFVVIGHCDSTLAIDKNVSKRLAILDAKRSISEYLIDCIVSEESGASITEILDNAKKGEFEDEVKNENSRDHNAALRTFITNYTNSQISTLIVEKVQYREAFNSSNIPYIESAVLCTVSDRLVKEIHDQLTIALENDKTINSESLEVRRSWLKEATKMTSDKFLQSLKSFFKKNND